MTSLPAGMLGVVALAPLAGAQGFVPERTSVLFAPGSAEVTVEARDVVLGFLRPPRPAGFAGHCLRGHADRGLGAEALALARARAIAAVMARQGVDPADVEVSAAGDRVPVRLAPPGRAEPMNDRVEMIPCPGPRLAGVAEAEARALDAPVVLEWPAGIPEGESRWRQTRARAVGRRVHCATDPATRVQP